MFTITLACVCAPYLLISVTSLPVQTLSLPSTLRSNSIALNASTATLPWSPKTFPIPSSSITLRLQKGGKLGQLLLQALIDSATDFIANQADEYGEGAFCKDMPFRYDGGEGVEISVWYILHPFTWSQLATIVRGLRLWILDGRRYRAYHFEVGGVETLDGYPWLGWGDVGTARRLS